MTAAPKSLEGRTLGEFTLRDKIGEGGFAAVHRAYQPALEREAVVKVLHARLANRSDVTQRFLRESRLASRLDHPYAAHVYAFGAESDGTLWIAMELVRGTPMDQLLEQSGAIPLERFVPLFERICEVVQTAHERGIVHRDLKPANVMVLSRAGRLLPKLLDFGIAHVGAEARPADDAKPNDGEDDPRPTRAGAVMGSPPYMAPEQWADASSVGRAADVYALGVLAYEALTGRKPFVASSMEGYMHAHASSTPAPLGSGLETLDPVLLRALAKLPEDRYGTAGDLAAAVRSATGHNEADVLPELDEPVRIAISQRAPQPLAEAIAALEGARNIDQACALVRDAVTTTAHWIGILAIAVRTAIGPGSDTDTPAVLDRLRELGRGELAATTWIELARAITLPFVDRRDAYTVPDLVTLLHGERDTTFEPPFLAAFHRLNGLRSALDGRAGRSDEQRRELYAEALVALADLLRPLGGILDYTVVTGRARRAERWRGLRRTPRPVVVRRAAPLPEGEVHLLDVDGRPVLRLSPLVQITRPAPGKDEELFLFAGRDSIGARLVAVPYGFEHHDEGLESWFREHLMKVAPESDADSSISFWASM